MKDPREADFMPRMQGFGVFMRVLVVLTMVAASVPAGCNQPRTSDKDLSFVDPAGGEDLVRETRSGVLGMGEAKAGVWIDCRPEKDFAERHIPGAMSMPYEVVTEQHDSLTGYGAVIVYADTYNDARAHGMAKRLIELGHENVYTLRGGLDGWIKSGRAVQGTKKEEAAEE